MPIPRRSTLLFLFVPCALALLALILIKPAPAPVPAPATPVEPTVTRPQADLILDLFEPTATPQSAADLSRKIEQALVVTYLLKQCAFLNETEYTAAYNAFIRYAVATQLTPSYPEAVTRVRTLADSANATYAFVYGRVPCTDRSLPQLKDQLQGWIKQIP